MKSWPNRENRAALPLSFFSNPDVLAFSKELLGKKLVTSIGGVRTAGIIVETEAYAGTGDRACHAYGGRCTSRTATMYRAGGVAYVYLCYGIHHLLNIVSGHEGEATAVLIRALEPAEGIDLMLKRRKKEKFTDSLAAGPGSLTRALGITTSHDTQLLTGPEIWLEEGVPVPPAKIRATPRVGVGYAKVDAALPWRFRIKGSRFTSKAR